MNGQDHARALRALQTGVVHADRLIERLIWIKSHFVFDIATPFRIDVVTVARRIDLHIVHAFAYQRLNLRLDDRDDIPEESRVARIDFVADALLVVDRRKLISSWQGNLDVAGAVLLQEGELVLGETAGLFDSAHYNSWHARDLGRRASGARLPCAQQVITLVEPLDSFVEVAHKVMATKLAIREYFEAKLFLAL